jgi:hypothetical protein
MFNQYSLSVMGIMFEIIGSFFLTLEAFGFKWIEKPLLRFIAFANWTRKSLLRTGIIVLILLLPFLSGMFLKSKTIAPLLLPISVFILLFTTLFDASKTLKEWTLIVINKKKIGPLGFIMLLIGNTLQLISIIIQIK